ncbi:heavy metal-associated isoprenylated plant protein 32-like [Primulina eburnea]|uniref:heavy metal-associated isoprenylated plant protein 32-like n=1 Tax=Primulina eburnea TaxID=1245227 RepID=UPI003C6C1A08
MSKDEFLKIQTCVLKVNIHCDGCKQKVKKTLQKIDGVYTIKIDSEQGKVTVSGNVDPATLIKKLIKNGKRAEIWGGVSKPHHNFQNQLNNHFKNLMTDNGKGGNNKGDIKKGGDEKLKGGGQDPVKLLQQLQQMKGFQDLKPLPLNKGQNQKSGKLNLPEDEDLSDDEFDDDDEYDDDDDEYDDDDDDEDDVEDAPLNKMKPVGGNGHGGSFMSNLLMNSQNVVKAGGNNGGNGGENYKKGGGGESDGANGGKKDGNQSQGGGKGGGAQPKDIKNGGDGGGQNNKNDYHGGSGATNGKILMPNGAKKSGGMIDETSGMPNMMNMNLPIGKMGNIPTRPIGSFPAVQGLPALNASSGGGVGYFHGGGPEQMAGNHPYHQQQQLAAMMNQRRANVNENFQPMMYARPPPAVNYMPSYLPYPYPPPPGELIDQYSMFSDENTSGCNIM